MPIAPAIVAREVSYAFGRGELRQQVLSGISLDIERGEIIVLTGPSGSGKTTLLTLCGALRTLEQGSLKVLGQELRGASVGEKNAARHRMGFIFQAHHLLNALTAQQNVALALGVDGGLNDRERKRRAAEMLEAVGLSHRLGHYPEEMSGGQKQRVAVARALVRNPAIVLADEPTASLDRKAGREVIELLLRIARTQNTTILLVTHDLRVMDVADRTIHLEDGILVEQGWMPRVQRNADLAELIRRERSGALESWMAGLGAGELEDALDRLAPALDAGLQLLAAERQNVGVGLPRRLLAGTVEGLRRELGAAGAELERFDVRTLGHSAYLVTPASGSGAAEDMVLDLWLQGREGQMIGRLRMRRHAGQVPFSEREVEVLQGFEKGLGLLFHLSLSLDGTEWEVA